MEREMGGDEGRPTGDGKGEMVGEMVGRWFGSTAASHSSDFHCAVPSAGAECESIAAVRSASAPWALPSPRRSTARASRAEASFGSSRTACVGHGARHGTGSEADRGAVDGPVQRGCGQGAVARGAWTGGVDDGAPWRGPRGKGLCEGRCTGLWKGCPHLVGESARFLIAAQVVVEASEARVRRGRSRAGMRRAAVGAPRLGDVARVKVQVAHT